jgi:hypothetical protein
VSAHLIVLLVIALVVVVPIAVLAVRLRKGDLPTGGSSWGRQLFGGRKQDWGPTPTPRREDHRPEPNGVTPPSS